jgi:hypothetical protein
MAWWDVYRRIRSEFSKTGKVELSSKWARLFTEKNENVVSRGRWEQMGNFLRPPMIQPVECRNVRVSNIVMSNIRRTPFDLNMSYEKVPAEPVSERTPVLRNLHFSDVTVRGAPAAGYILGLDEMPVENVTFSNLSIDADKGFSCSNAKNLVFRNLRIDTKKGPALLGEKIEGLELAGVRMLAPHPDAAVVDLKDVAGAYLHICRTTPGVFLHLRGQSSRDILLQANGFGTVTSAVKMDEGVSTAALIWK